MRVLPSIVHVAATVAHGAAGITRAVITPAPDELADARRWECECCQAGHGFTCPYCGCVRWAKTRDPASRCPQNRWPAANSA